MTALTVTAADSFNCRRTLVVEGKRYEYFSLPDAEKNGLLGISRLPFSLKVLLENLLRFEDGQTVKAADIQAMASWLAEHKSEREIAFRPARVLMQDFTGVPAVVDLAAMRDAMKAMGGNPAKINPLVPVDLVIDHSVMVDAFGNGMAFKTNVEMEYARNQERYEFLRWGAGAFDNFRVVPPGTGICHQVNLEYLAQTVWTKTLITANGEVTQAFPDTLVGTDSHTTMVNGLAVLGWGVGGIEAEAAMLGQPISMVIPEVIGFRMTGCLREGVTATDLVLTVTQMLRKKGVVGKFVEFFGTGLGRLTLEDQATISNMAPEYGATCGFFPIDKDTLAYLRATGREAHRLALVEAYAKAQGMWRDDSTPDPEFTDTLELDLDSVEPSLAGPRRPQDRVALATAAEGFTSALAEIRGYKPGSEQSRMTAEGGVSIQLEKSGEVEGESYSLSDGDVVIAAITSCTNTSNPSVLVAAGLVARNAHAKGLKVKPWVKTSLAPGSQVVTDYLTKSGLQADLDALGFDLVGYGCTTCIGNSGPLPEQISATINKNDLVAAAVLSGNRNFEGRVNQDVRANYLASPPLVVAYALAGSMHVNLVNDPLGTGADGNPVYLRDIWPTSQEVAEIIRTTITPALFTTRYADVFKGDERWQALGASQHGLTYSWNNNSTYVQNPPYFEDLQGKPAPVGDIENARILGSIPRFHHHRPYQPGRLDRPDRSRRTLSDRAWRDDPGVQLLRRAARQPRSDDARHFRQYPYQEPDGSRHRRRRHAARAERRTNADLRGGHALSGRECAAGYFRGQGIRHRLQPRLGGERHAAARCPGRDRAEFRAHPSLQPRRHGRAAAGLRGRHLLADTRPDGQGKSLHRRVERAEAANLAHRQYHL